MPSICLNMIVRNEADRIARCLNSVAPFITSAAIVDTGSTDHTKELIRDTLKVPVEISDVPFRDFSQSRNAALSFARKSVQKWDYLLLCDADMELHVTDDTVFDRALSQDALAYDLQQRGGSLYYWNTRLLSRKSKGIYHGVTHEFLGETGTSLEGAHFIDHADGANRPDKSERDIRLLLEGLSKEPNNVRYWFYLAQSYRDVGQWEKAAEAYKKRVALGGWDEEVWQAQTDYATCVAKLGDKDIAEARFIKEKLIAYEMRPSRAEPLYDLAKHFRETGRCTLGTTLAKIGMEIPYSRDKLFVSDYVYRYGLRDEFSICGFYQPENRKAAFKVCNDLALDRDAPEFSRNMARGNLFHYLEPLCKHLPMLSYHRIPFTAPDGYVAMNPSITREGNNFVCIVRTVNYSITDSGHYEIRGADGTVTNSNPIHTRSFLVRLSDKFEPILSKEILLPTYQPLYHLVRGFEDMRLFPGGGELWFSATARDLNSEGWCEIVVGKITEHGDTAVIDEWWKVDPAFEKANQKNWMPWRDRKWVYRLGTVINAAGVKVSEDVPKLATDHICGGSQVVPFVSRNYLAVVHEARERPDNRQRYYQHRFAELDEYGKLLGISRPFVFHDKQIEFAMGLTHHPDGSMLISYGVRDREAYIAKVDIGDIAAFMDG